jgi:hypothetical protein
MFSGETLLISSSIDSGEREKERKKRLIVAGLERLAGASA